MSHRLPFSSLLRKMWFPVILTLTIHCCLGQIDSGSTLIEGDILIRGSDSGATLFNLSNIWEGGEVVYRYGSSFTNDERKILKKAMGLFKENTCITFREAEDDDHDFVNILKSQEEVCASYIGRRGGEQKLLLHSNCFTLKTVLHQFMHTLGFAHEHTRPDRDNYITVHEHNMAASDRNHLKKRLQKELTQLTPGNYGYHSIMQRTSHEGSINGEAVVTAKRSEIVLGSPEDRVRDYDLLRINTIYHCESPKSRGADQQWRSGEDGVWWAFYCDFAGNDIATVKGLGEDCGGHCASHPRCTHFTYSKIDGGTCYLKAGFPKGTVPWCLDPKHWVGAVCGLAGSPSDYGLTKMVSCRVYQG